MTILTGETNGDQPEISRISYLYALLGKESEADQAQKELFSR